LDELDLLIVKNLLKNCRVTYRELADKYNISINAIFKRVQNMVNEGIISAFTAKPSSTTLKSIEINVFGTSKVDNLNYVISKLGENEAVFFVGIAGGNFIIIGAYLKDISELHSFTSFCIREAKLESYTECILSLLYNTSPESLSSLDYKIIKQLNRDARRSIPELAENIGISAKTARKRIKRMIDKNLVDFSIDFVPASEGIIVSLFFVYLNQDSDFEAEYQKINDNYSTNIIYLRKCSNKPNLLLLTVMTKSNQETAKLNNKLMSEGFENVKHRMIFDGRFYENWREKLYRKILSN
jgi:DNA-binding Lrp family transcriptional regulator